MKKCPYCAEEIQDDATICRFCNNSVVNKKVKKSNNGTFSGFWFLVIVAFVGFLVWDSGFFDSISSNKSFADTTCRDVQEDAIGGEVSRGIETFKIIDIRNSKEISRTDSKLVCIGDLMYEGTAGSKIRMELTYEDDKLWSHYETMN